MEVIRSDEIIAFENSGVISRQLIFPENSNSERVAITKVSMPPGTINPRHAHESSEQIWVALEGHGLLMLSEDQTLEFQAGDVVRFSENEIHGFHNTGNVDFVYLSVMSPPLNFRTAYEREWSA
ncbi:MAG: cupin domain-containing protein [Hahellaceae bacterium]|nr:cupin domain-containing protein [Hahellaceae bacterium]MCP5168985.1 cupin domain-containing protein [Hahellaceae bacterium]